MSTIDTRGPVSSWLGGVGQGINLGGTLLDERFRREQLAQQAQQFEQNQLLQQAELEARLQADAMRNQQASAMLGFRQLANDQKIAAENALRMQKFKGTQRYLMSKLQPRGGVGALNAAVRPGMPSPMRVAPGENVDDGGDGQSLGIPPAGRHDTLYDLIDNAQPGDEQNLEKLVDDQIMRENIDAHLGWLKKNVAYLPEGTFSRWLVDLADRTRDAKVIQQAEQAVTEEANQPRVAAALRVVHPGAGATAEDMAAFPGGAAEATAFLRSNNVPVGVGDANFSGETRGRDRTKVLAEYKAIDESTLDEREKAQLLAPLRKELGLGATAPDSIAKVPRGSKGKPTIEAARQAKQELGPSMTEAQLKQWLSDRGYVVD